MCTQRHGDIFFSDVDAYTQALGIDIREMMFGLLGIFVRHVQTDMLDSMFFISLSWHGPRCLAVPDSDASRISA